ncbi:MAG: glutamate-5-semialdehyde dehydrogenase [Chitinophagaceae bacterium]|nr:MAG: glutamate-5-semialdehyde dehydrogenase [Chitinophagaceae bacterium]
MSSIDTQLRTAKDASLAAKDLTDAQKVSLLKTFATAIRDSIPGIIINNKKDLKRMDPKDPRYDRLILDEIRIEALAKSLEDVSRLKDPTHQELYRTTLENGLKIKKITVPLGVVGVIYESRPNVTVDVAALCIKSGNAVLLRGGSDAWYSNRILVDILRKSLQASGANPDIIQLLPPDREYVHDLLQAEKYVDIIIPRGSQHLIDFVRNNSKIPVIETGAGVCHTYVDKTADLEKAAKIVYNAKVNRPSVCNALDTVLVDKEVADEFLSKLTPLFESSRVMVHADRDAYSILERQHYPQLQKAEESDFGREFLSLACSVKVVPGLDQALQHIREYSSRHSECIVSQDKKSIEKFLNDVDAAVVYSNASTRFTDGAVFGLGAEIGISTQKLHARGPFALEKLVTEKWVVEGDGQVRE